MSKNSMIQLLEDQFLHWAQDMEKKQEEQARKMKELQDDVESLPRENDRLRAQIEKRCYLSGRDVQANNRALHPVPRNKGKKPIILDEADVAVNDELSLGSSPPLGLSPTKNTRSKSCKRTLHRPTFSDAVSGASCRERREEGRGQYQPDRAPGDALVFPTCAMPSMPFVLPPSIRGRHFTCC